MKRILLLSSFLFALSGLAQKGHMAGKRGIKLHVDNDSMLIKIRQLQDSVKKTDSVAATTSQQQTSQDFQAIKDLKVPDSRKQKRTALIRIGIGLGFLCILITGLMRKRKKTGNKTV